MLFITKFFQSSSRYQNLFLCFLSSGLLILSFPKIDWWLCSWFGLVPLMMLLEWKTPKAAFGWSYLCGVVYFSVLLYWLVYVDPLIAFLGFPLMVLYLSLYFGLFGLAYVYIRKKPVLWKIFLLPGCWVALEYLRAHLFSGFDWGSFGYSQYKNLMAIQIADMTGVFGVSFLVVMANVVLKEWFEAAVFQNFSSVKKDLISAAAAFSAFLILSLGYGVFCLSQVASNPSVSIAVVQANTPQELKWYKPAWPVILQDYRLVTEEVAAQSPQLIIWPETSFPGILGEDDDLFKELQPFIARIGIPIVAGSLIKENDNYYNSAVLLSKDGEVLQRYHKLHLVPFGEYVPFRSFFPFISQVVPIADLSFGKDHTVFNLLFERISGNVDASFSVLICFEDAVADIARQFVKNGAQALVNITNDAWFKDTKAAFLHLQSSVLRSVENRRYVVRAANTGVSCFIDPNGRITDFVQDANGKKTFVPGYRISNIQLISKRSFYTQFGDIFAFLCLAGVMIGFVYKRKK